MADPGAANRSGLGFTDRIAALHYLLATSPEILQLALGAATILISFISPASTLARRKDAAKAFLHDFFPAHFEGLRAQLLWTRCE